MQLRFTMIRIISDRVLDTENNKEQHCIPCELTMILWRSSTAHTEASKEDQRQEDTEVSTAINALQRQLETIVRKVQRQQEIHDDQLNLGGQQVHNW